MNQMFHSIYYVIVPHFIPILFHIPYVFIYFSELSLDISGTAKLGWRAVEARFIGHPVTFWIHSLHGSILHTLGFSLSSFLPLFHYLTRLFLVLPFFSRPLLKRPPAKKNDIPRMAINSNHDFSIINSTTLHTTNWLSPTSSSFTSSSSTCLLPSSLLHILI